MQLDQDDLKFLVEHHDKQEHVDKQEHIDNLEKQEIQEQHLDKQEQHVGVISEDNHTPSPQVIVTHS